jgi:hypothetical protein
MPAVELVAVAHEDEGGNALYPAPEQANDVERCLVRPVDIFDDEHGRGISAELAHQRGRDLVGFASLWTSASNSPPVDCATSISGPSGRGVKSASQAPQRIRVELLCSSRKRRRSAVFPTPVSPPTSTSRPQRSTRTSASNAASVPSSCCRSRSSIEPSPVINVVTTEPPHENIHPTATTMQGPSCLGL